MKEHLSHYSGCYLHKTSYTKDRQSTYNDIKSRFRAAIFAVENKYILHILNV
jgi:hypothetical protein